MKTIGTRSINMNQPQQELLDAISAYSEALAILVENKELFNSDDYMEYLSRITTGLQRTVDLLSNDESSKSTC